MAVEIFLVPIIGSGTRLDPFRAKYIDDPAVTKDGSIRYSRQSDTIALIQAPQAYLDSVAAQPDATRLATPANIDSPLTQAQADAAASLFESKLVPGSYFQEGIIRRQALRGVIGTYLFAQRLEGKFGVGWPQRAQDNGITLNTTWSQLPTGVQDELKDVRDSFGWPNLGITGSSTVREILKAVSLRFRATPFFLAGFEI